MVKCLLRQIDTDITLKKRSKYFPLYKHLHTIDLDEVTFDFATIEQIMGKSLPTSARGKRAWWSNRKAGGHQASAWIEAGYRVHAFDLDAETVTFRKIGLLAVYQVERKRGTVMWNSAMIRALREHTNMSQTELAEELGMRQQTISEWETGMYAPTRSSSKFLGLIAEQANFEYDANLSVSE